MRTCFALVLLCIWSSWQASHLTCSVHIWWAGCQPSGCNDTSQKRHRPPLRSCRCRPSSLLLLRDSEGHVPRHWDPCGEWWFGKAERKVGWGEGARHSCDPDNTQRKTVASSNNGCSGKKGNGKWRRMKMRAKQQVCETVQLLITEAVCGYRRLTGQMLRLTTLEAAPVLSASLTVLLYQKLRKFRNRKSFN